jgi:hypothetical protein
MQIAVNAKSGKEAWRQESSPAPGHADHRRQSGVLLDAGRRIQNDQCDDGRNPILDYLGTAASRSMTYQHNGKQYVVQALGGLPGSAVMSGTRSSAA